MAHPPPEARHTPRHIVEDAALAPTLLNFVRDYLQTNNDNTAVPSELLLATLSGPSLRQDETREVFECKGRRALDAHADGITKLATANNGMGTELIRDENETGSCSIIFKV